MRTTLHMPFLWGMRCAESSMDRVVSLPAEGLEFHGGELGGVKAGRRLGGRLGATHSYETKFRQPDPCCPRDWHGENGTGLHTGFLGAGWVLGRQENHCRLPQWCWWEAWEPGIGKIPSLQVCRNPGALAGRSLLPYQESLNRQMREWPHIGPLTMVKFLCVRQTWRLFRGPLTTAQSLQDLI